MLLMVMVMVMVLVMGQNNPLFVQTYRSDNVVTGMQEDPIKFHYILHCSLDAFEEKGKNAAAAAGAGDDDGDGDGDE